MSITHTINPSWTGPDNNRLSRPVALTGNEELNVDQTVAAGGTNVLVDYACSNSALQSFYLVSDQAVTVKFNSTGSPILTLALAAGVPYVWHAQDAHANPFSAAITALYVTNAGGTAAQLSLRSLRS